MQKITPCLWFNGNAEEAAKLYVSVFKHSKIGAISRYDTASARASGMPEGSALTVAFEINGQEFIALNGGPMFAFSEAVSFVINCENQEEIDHYWNALTADGGQESQCGWLKDKYGVSWQVVPTILGTLLSGADKAKAERAMKAMLEMKKIDIGALQGA